MINKKFRGEIIYATPGSGKTHLSKKYSGVIDTDDIMVDVIREISPNFDVLDNCDPRINIFQYHRYIKFRKSSIKKLLKRTYTIMKDYADLEKILLLGTLDLMHVADIIYVQTKDTITEERGFKQSKEETKIDELIEDGQISWDQVKKMNNYLEYYLTKR